MNMKIILFVFIKQDKYTLEKGDQMIWYDIGSEMLNDSRVCKILYSILSP